MPPLSEPDNSKSSPAPDLLGSLIVILVSAAITIFVFWASSQFLSRDTFAKLPEFITNTYKAIWSSAAAGTAGIGLAIVRAFTVAKGEPQPHYLKFIGITTGCLVALVTGLVIFTQHSDNLKPEPIPIPPNIVRLSAKDSSAREFDLENPVLPVSYITYILRGHFAVKDHNVKGKLESGRIVVSKDAPHNFPEKATRVSFRIFFIHKVNGRDQLDSYPATPKTRESIELNLNLTNGATYDLPSGDFEFDLPEGQSLDRAWLTAAIWTGGDSYFPAQ